MSGKLYLVGTPIGNLGDISRRCAETLEMVDFIAAEDTRVSRKLLNHLDIRKSLVSYYEHNSRESGQRILERLLAGESCALVTDAGMPAISDPGEDLVRLCAEAGVEVVAVPGPSAVVSALALSGLPTGRFTFEGFLSVTRRERQEHLASLQDEKRTMVFYEAPHKLAQTLDDLCAAFGEERSVALCREMTKLHEEVIRCTLGEAIRPGGGRRAEGRQNGGRGRGPGTGPGALRLRPFGQGRGASGRRGIRGQPQRPLPGIPAGKAGNGRIKNGARRNWSDGCRLFARFYFLLISRSFFDFI